MGRADESRLLRLSSDSCPSTGITLDPTSRLVFGTPHEAILEIFNISSPVENRSDQSQVRKNDSQLTRLNFKLAVIGSEAIPQIAYIQGCPSFCFLVLDEHHL